MTEQEYIESLTNAGYVDVRVCPINTEGVQSEPHTHDEHTVHIILEGKITIEENGTKTTYKKGDKIDFPAGTTHAIQTPAKGAVFITGVKK